MTKINAMVSKISLWPLEKLLAGVIFCRCITNWQNDASHNLHHSLNFTNFITPKFANLTQFSQKHCYPATNGYKN